MPVEAQVRLAARGQGIRLPVFWWLERDPFPCRGEEATAVKASRKVDGIWREAVGKQLLGEGSPAKLGAGRRCS